ncbi:MAG: hypothetical protein R2752_22065 [Vicinamibacterales bacterium]
MTRPVAVRADRRRPWARSVAALTAVLLPLAVVASAQRPTLKPEEKRGSGWERWADRVPVSGGIRVGVMALDGRTIENLERMTIRRPTSDLPWLCVEISSRDGRYSGRLSYRLHDAPEGLIDLEVPTEKVAELRDYAAGDLAILASLATSCDGPPETFVVAAWDPRVANDHVVVLINSRVPTTIVRASDNASTPCTPLDGVTTAFNLSCQVPAAWLEPKVELVIRMRRGRSFSNVPLHLAWPR